MRYTLQARWQAAGGFFFASLCSYIPGIVHAAYAHQSRQKGIVQYAQNGRLIFMQFFC